MKDTLYFVDGDPDVAVVALDDSAFLELNKVGHRDRVLQTRYADDKGKR